MEIDTLDANNILLKLQNNLDLVDAIGGVCMVAFIFVDKPPNRGASVHTTFTITGPDQVTTNKIIEGGLWNLHGVPFGQYSVENAKTIGEAYGEVLQVEDPFQYPDGVWGFLRICLQLDARKPIPTGFWLAREEEKSSRVEFYYETQRIHTLCFTCGRLGLINSGCQLGPDLQPATGNSYSS
ncbi:hypothetical protein ACFX2B_019220 [Malus domestica]